MADLEKIAELLEATAAELHAALSEESTQTQLLGRRSGRPMPTIGNTGGRDMEAALEESPYTQEEINADLQALEELARTENRRETGARRVAQALPVIARIGTKLLDVLL